ncbi:LADA_0D12222g1_1 [Lachancea dasiensis]|uniref:LADA_0D12222g1_1 n=1 Tax=Lachancea dasiensis TaxID=1072105 RepID=A0A1G4J837_9SACH|nr:LADA_0D12222g1_1 [Lachancea dasiensis]
MFTLSQELVKSLPKKSLDELKSFEQQSCLPTFDYNTAFNLGCQLRQWGVENFPTKAMVIDISLPSGQCVFHTTTNSGTALDNDIWVARKKKTVVRFGCSSYFMGQKLKSKKLDRVEDAFYIDSKEYAVHGGSIPVFVQGIDSAVAILTVSGLKQEEDHAFAVSAIIEYAQQLKSAEMEDSNLDLD